MIDCTIRPLDPNAPGSWAELMRANRVLRGADVDAIEALVREIITHHSDAQDVDAVIASLAINDLRAIVDARYGGAQTGDPLPARTETIS